MIYVDVSAAVHARAGLGRYAERVATEMYKIAPDEVRFFHNLASDGKIPESLVGKSTVSVKQGYKPWRMAVWMAHLGRVNFDRLLPEVELFHSTEHLLFPTSKPTVLTMHDLIYKLFPEYHKRLNYWYLNAAVPLFCKRATRIIAVSEASKRDIVTHYGIDPAKIDVVYEAASELFTPPTPQKIAEVRQRYDLPPNYLIHLSTIEPRKNLDRLVTALLSLRGEFPDLTLCLAGSKGWLYEDFFARIETDGLGDIVRHLGWIPDEDLPAVLAGARLGVQPSLYEGFGLPILELMGVGQAVAASGVSSHPEVGGSAALYFQPETIGEMVEVIATFLRDDALLHKHKALGLEQAARFSWEKTAQETWKVYEKARGK